VLIPRRRPKVVSNVGRDMASAWWRFTHAHGLAIVEFRVCWPQRIVDMRRVEVGNKAAGRCHETDEAEE
jgi:hypothetical protein